MTDSKTYNFKKTFIYTAVMFVIVLTIIEAVFSLFSETGFSGFLQNFSYPTIIRFGIAKIIGAAIYGLFMAFILKKRAEKISK